MQLIVSFIHSPFSVWWAEVAGMTRFPGFSMPDRKKIMRRETSEQKGVRPEGSDRVFRSGAWCHAFLSLWMGIFLFFGPGAAFGQDARIFSVPYSHFSQQEPLATVLTDFARTQGFSAVISEGLDGKLSGRFEKVAPRTFLESLEQAFDLRWYLLDGTLHFYPARESRRELIAAPNLGGEKLAEQLVALGLVSPQLPLGTPETGNGLLAVQGPPGYVAQLRAAAQALEKTADRRVMRVFKLKYATADDRDIDSMGRRVTIPGVASILRAMTQGRDIPGTVVSEQKATVSKLKGSGLVARGNAPETGTSAAVETAATTAEPAADLTIVADPRVNAVVVQDLQSRIPYYEQVVADLDRPTNLVEIHAAIVDVDSTFTRNLGIDWQVDRDQDQHYDRYNFSGLGVNSPDGNSDVSGSGLFFSTIYTRGSNYFQARIRAMESDGAARILGRPSVLTADNLEATLENITTYYISISGQEEVDLFKVEAGTVLRVTPHIIENEQGAPSIRLAVTVQDDQQNDGQTIQTGNMPIPSIKQTKINTQAIVDEGQSLLLGGYYFEKKGESESGVPILMHLPVLGSLFRSATTDTRQMERLILITPRIVRLGETQRLPSQVTNVDFGREPGQADYEVRKTGDAGGARE
jgi:type III secretion protein C